MGRASPQPSDNLGGSIRGRHIDPWSHLTFVHSVSNVLCAKPSTWLLPLLVLLTFTVIAPPLFSKLWLTPTLIGMFGLQASLSKNVASKALTHTRKSASANIRPCVRKVCFEQFQQCAYSQSRRTRNSIHFAPNLESLFLETTRIKFGAKVTKSPPSFVRTVSASLLAWQYWHIIHCVRAIAKMPSARESFCPTKLPLSALPTAILRLSQTNFGFSNGLSTDYAAARDTGMTRLMPFFN